MVVHLVHACVVIKLARRGDGARSPNSATVTLLLQQPSGWDWPRPDIWNSTDFSVNSSFIDVRKLREFSVDAGMYVTATEGDIHSFRYTDIERGTFNYVGEIL
jgi:hypothetical protein